MNLKTLTAHVLRAIASAHRFGRPCNLEMLAQEIGVRRGDVRHCVTSLHREGFVDALRMKPTLAGFALSRALEGATLGALRSATSERPVATRDEAKSSRAA
jgi:DNA-binding IscR family transcriptional regulator